MRLRWCTLPLLSGTLDDRIYTMDKYEKVQEWLMDPDECPTQWPQLHAIRAQNPNYNCRPYSCTPEDGGSPAPSQLSH